jgi:hypothetical protein
MRWIVNGLQHNNVPSGLVPDSLASTFRWQVEAFAIRPPEPPPLPEDHYRMRTIRDGLDNERRICI